MRVTKRMYHKELRPYYMPMKILAYMMTKKWGIKLMNFIISRSKGKNIEGLHCEERYIPSRNNGPDIRIRIFKPHKSDKILPGMLYNHGGGYMTGAPEMAIDTIKSFIDKRPCVIIAPDYRKSLNAPFPSGFNDCYDTLLWMKENAHSLGVKSSKFIVAGHSAGGGLTAAVTLKARDTQDVDIAFQMPIYPMIDYLQNTKSAKSMNSVPVWNRKTNALGWRLYLKNTKGKVSPYASPSINKDYKKFPPTITFVGDLEPFKDETIKYVNALKEEQITVNFKLFEGAFHAFENFGKNTEIGKKANQFQFESFAKYYDKYTK